MAYSQISIIAVDNAQAGEVINATVKVENLGERSIYVIPVLRVNGEWANEGSYRRISPFEISEWSLEFIMPNVNASLLAESWVEDTFPWQLDDTAQKVISLAAPEPLFRNLTVAVRGG